MISNEQWKEIVDAIEEMDEESVFTKGTVKAAIRQLLDKEPLRIQIIQLLALSEDLGLEVTADEDTEELTILTGTVLPAGAQTYSKIVFMSDDDDEEDEDATE